MPSSPPRPNVQGAGPSPSHHGGGHDETSPLLHQRSSNAPERNSSSNNHSGFLRGAAARDAPSSLSSKSASTAAASSLSVNNSSAGEPSRGSESSSDCGNRLRVGNDGSDTSNSSAAGGGGGERLFGVPPTSLFGFLVVFAHSVTLQSWTSYVLAASFHAFHVLLILSFLMSPILFRSTIFSPQTMEKALLEAQGIIKQKSKGSNRESNNNKRNDHSNAPLLPSSVAHAPVSIESVWAIHDAIFFLEPGHVVKATTIENSFGSLRHGKNHKKGDVKAKIRLKGETGKNGDGKADMGGMGDRNTYDKSSNKNGDGDNGEKKADHEDTHAYIVPHDGSGGGDDEGGKTEKLLDATTRVTTVMIKEVVDEGREGEKEPFYNFAVPPPVAPKMPFRQRKSATHGRATLSKILNAWEASPLYSSPLALTLFYYLYNIGCIILLLTVTDGKLTGHFSVLRLFISLAELLWYVHHGAHAFVIYCWMFFLSHWPRRAPYAESDVAFLGAGTPYAVVTRASGTVSMHWFYHPTSGDRGNVDKNILQDVINLQYYLYDQVWYLKPVASAIAVIYLVLLSFCIARDLNRVLDAVVGVRVLMEPEGCVRCPLCGELMEICQQHRGRRGKSIYQSAREGTSLSVRRTMWWWRWLRSAVRGSSSGHRVPTPRLRSPLWCWLLPEWCGGGPQEAGKSVVAMDMNGSVLLEAHRSEDASYTIADMLDDVEFYEQSALHRSAAAPQDTMTEETAHLMRRLTMVSKSDMSVAVLVKGEKDGSDSDDEAADALGIGFSGSSSEDEMETGLVKAMPAETGLKQRLSVRALSGARETMRSSTSSRSLQSPMRHYLRSGQRRRRHSYTRSPDSTNSSHPQMKPHRVSRFTEEVLYWNYATRHVHHRCPKLHLDTKEATDDEATDDGADETGSDDGNSTASTSEASSSASSAETGGATGKEERVAGTLATPATAASTRGHMGDAPTIASRAAFSDRGMRRSLSPCATASRENLSAPVQSTSAADTQGGEKPRQLRRGVPQRPALHRTTSAPTTGPTRGDSTTYEQDTSTSKNAFRGYGTIGPSFSETPAQLCSRATPPEKTANHIVQRGVYEPTKDEEDEFRPGNAFQSFDRAGWLSRLTYSWLNPLLTFGLLEPTLLRQERFLPPLPEQLLSLENIAVPAWRLWVQRKNWYATYVAKPGELLIPSNEAMERAEEQVMSLADLRDAEVSDDSEDTESSEGKQTVVMLGHTSLKQAAKFRPQRPKRSWKERVFWCFTAPIRFVLVFFFYYLYIGTSRTVRRTQRRLVRELLKDRLAAAAADVYDENGYQAMEANEVMEEATWALAEMASSCGSSAVTPSAGSALPTHMRRQLALSDVSLYHLFLEHRCGRRFLTAAPLLLLSELLALSVVPVLAIFIVYLQKVDNIEILPGHRETPVDQENVSVALSLASLIGVLLLLQGVVQCAYVSQVRRAAMEARTCVCAMVLEKTLALPLAQRTFSESEVVTLATEEATRVAKCILSLHHTWSCPLRVMLLALLLGYYLGWAAAVVACVAPLFIVRWLRHASHESWQSRHTAGEASRLRLSLLRQALNHIREVKGMLLEGRFMRHLRRVRKTEAAHAEKVAMDEGTSGMLAGGVTGLLMVVAIGVECIFSLKVLHDMDVLIPTLAIFVLLSAPLLELPTLFTVVARGFLSMKRIEAYLRQTPDEFVGTWVDLTTFSALQQQLKQGNPRSAFLHYRRGSVVCRGSSFTWQHDLTEESPIPLLRDVDLCIEPGQLVVVQGSIGSGKSTLLLSILGEVNRCVTAKGSDGYRGSSASDYESEGSFSVMSASEAVAAVAAAARASVPLNSVEIDSHAQANSTVNAVSFVSRGGASGGRAGQAAATAAAVAPAIFIASPTESRDGRQRQRTTTATAAAVAATQSAPQISHNDYKKRTVSTASHSTGSKSLFSDRDGTDKASAPTGSSPLTPAVIEDVESSTGGFLVFGSCAYCAEVPWLQNDTIRANIMSSGGPVQLERWYYTVLRACGLEADVAALPQGDATVVGDRGESLSLSMRCRIAVARAVYSRSHVYLFDSVLSPLEPALQEHIIREVFHKLLRKRTVVLASNVGLRSLRPHRVFSLVEGGIVREDTELYKAVRSLNARSDDDDQGEGEGMTRQESKGSTKKNDEDNNESESSHSTTSSGASQGTVAPPLPPLYAEEFEEPKEENVVHIPEPFDDDPMAAAAALLFDGHKDFGPRDLLFSELGGDRHDGVGSSTGQSNSFFYSDSAPNSGVPQPRRTVHFGPRSPTRPDSQLRSLSTPWRTPPGVVTLPPPVVPFLEAAATRPYTPTAAVASSRQSPALLQSASTPPQNAGENDIHGSDVHSETSSCSTGQYIRNHYAQQLEREKMLRHRHRLSFFIFLRFMGAQVIWLVLTTLFQQFVYVGVDMWAAVWLAVMDIKQQDDDVAAATPATVAINSDSSQLSTYARVWAQLYILTSVTDTVFLVTVAVLMAMTMVLTLLRTRAVHVGVYGTMHFIYDQIVRRILHAPASYFDSRIIALLTRVLESDAEVAEYRVPGTAEVLLSCATQAFFIVVWNAFVNPIFLLFLPVMVSLFYHISQRHALVLREVRKLEASSVSGTADLLREVYQGAPTVRCMALQDRLREEYCRALDTVNTASMVAYFANCWVELRLHVLTSLAVCSAAMLGVVFTFTYSRPSFTAVAVVVALRAGPVLCTMCQSLGRFAVTEWISVQRLMSLWSVPQEPLTLEGEADMYNYSHVRRQSCGLYVELEGGQNAPLLDLVGTPVSSPSTLAAVSLQEHPKGQKNTIRGKKGEGSSTPLSPLSAFAAASSSSSFSSSSSTAASGDKHETGEGAATMTLPLLELRNVSARYRTTLPYVLRHVNLAVYPRERLGVVGHAGQGKGSLFNVIMRLVDVIEGGGVFIDGEDAARVPYPVLRGWFGLVPQEPLLFHGSWRSNLLTGYHPEHRLLIANGNGKGGRLSTSSTHHARIRQQSLPQEDENRVSTSPVQTAERTSHRTTGPQRDATPSGSTAERRSENRHNTLGNNHSHHNIGSTGDVAAPLPASANYGSTSSTHAFMDGDGQGRVRYMDSMEEDGLSRVVSCSAADRKDGGLFSTLVRAARWPLDRCSPSHRHSNRSNTSDGGRRDLSVIGEAAGTARSNSNSSGGGGGGNRTGCRRRCRSGLLFNDNSRAASGHSAEASCQPVEEAALWDALRAVGLDVAVEFDGGLDAPLAGGDVTKTDLTESQCRLLCLARVVLHRPPIVLLEDAVLSGAEAQTDRVIRRVLTNELRDSTVIIIAHRMSTVLNLCTRVVAMDGGTLLPIADLHVATAPAKSEEESRANARRAASLPDLATPLQADDIPPEVLRRVSYYVE